MDDVSAVVAPALGSRQVAIPEPDTTRALLRCANGPGWTWHSYVRTERVGEVRAAWAFIFRCDETGSERRWGLEST